MYQCYVSRLQVPYNILLSILKSISNEKERRNKPNKTSYHFPIDIKNIFYSYLSTALVYSVLVRYSFFPNDITNTEPIGTNSREELKMTFQNDLNKFFSVSTSTVPILVTNLLAYKNENTNTSMTQAAPSLAKPSTYVRM